MNPDKKYYTVNSKRLAITIEFLSGLTYYAYNDRYKEGNTVYTFKNSEKLQEVLKYIDEGRSNLRFN